MQGEGGVFVNTLDLRTGDCREILPTLAAGSVHACVTDPPYGLSFMGKGWDHGVPGEPFWREVLRVLKPGAHLVAFGGTRTYHRLTCAIEDAGFEVRDCLMWLYGSGFPKSLGVAKAIDRANGVEREDKFEGAMDRRAGPTGNKKCEVCGKWLVSGSPCRCPRPQDRAVSAEAQRWEGWGTALKPAFEPIVLARKPLGGTVAENVQAHGTGALNVDGCRIGTEELPHVISDRRSGNMVYGDGLNGSRQVAPTSLGRWPANVLLDEEAAALLDAQSGSRQSGEYGGLGYNGWGKVPMPAIEGDSGGASRFFYTSKASRREREGSKHPTVKPLDLMRWLVRLVTPPGGTVLDPFAGTGTTGEAALMEGFSCVLIEREAEYVTDIENRLRETQLGLVLT
jgi:site-specific DNA-methyltransferase (adenine-specific)